MEGRGHVVAVPMDRRTVGEKAGHRGIRPRALSTSRHRRRRRPAGLVLFFTGLSGSGKSTIARSVRTRSRRTAGKRDAARRRSRAPPPQRHGSAATARPISAGSAGWPPRSPATAGSRSAADRALPLSTRRAVRHGRQAGDFQHPRPHLPPLAGAVTRPQGLYARPPRKMPTSASAPRPYENPRSRPRHRHHRRHHRRRGRAGAPTLPRLRP